MELSKEISWNDLKEFVRNLDVNKIELSPKEASLNEIASVGALLQIHAEALYSRAKVAKAKAELDKDAEMFKQFNEGAWEKELPKSEKVKRTITAERVEKINQDINEGEIYALKMIVEPHKEEADFAVAGFWQEKVLEVLRSVALNFIMGVLRGMIKEAIPRMVEMANSFLNSLENRIIDLYKKGDEDEQRIFKENLKKHFPNSRLIEKLN
jgi:hypothetical protein